MTDRLNFPPHAVFLSRINAVGNSLLALQQEYPMPTINCTACTQWTLFHSNPQVVPVGFPQWMGDLFGCISMMLRSLLWVEDSHSCTTAREKSFDFCLPPTTITALVSDYAKRREGRAAQCLSTVGPRKAEHGNTRHFRCIWMNEIRHGVGGVGVILGLPSHRDWTLEIQIVSMQKGQFLCMMTWSLPGDLQ